MEIACPILECREVGDFGFPTAVAASDSFEINSSESVAQVTGDEETAACLENSPASHCTDECLCHAVAIPSLVFDLPRICTKYTFSLVKFKDALSLAVSPPYHPPKLF